MQNQKLKNLLFILAVMPTLANSAVPFCRMHDVTSTCLMCNTRTFFFETKVQPPTQSPRNLQLYEGQINSCSADIYFSTINLNCQIPFFYAGTSMTTDSNILKQLASGACYQPKRGGYGVNKDKDGLLTSSISGCSILNCDLCEFDHKAVETCNQCIDNFQLSMDKKKCLKKVNITNCQSSYLDSSGKEVCSECLPQYELQLGGQQCRSMTGECRDIQGCTMCDLTNSTLCASCNVRLDGYYSYKIHTCYQRAGLFSEGALMIAMLMVFFYGWV